MRQIPARTWTSLATGQPADVHGVSGIEARAVSGIDGTVPAVGSRLAGAIAAATDLVRLTQAHADDGPPAPLEDVLGSGRRLRSAHGRS